MKRAFTLMELLVVIAIIALLAAILFPVFASAKEGANEAICLSNTKQIGHGMYLYISDYDGYYPGGNQEEAYPVPNIRSDSQVPYDVLTYPYIKSWEVFKSPSDKVREYPAGAQCGYWDPSFTKPLVPRSYSLTGNIVTRSGAPRLLGLDVNTGLCSDPDPNFNNYDPNQGSTGYSEDSVAQSATTIAFVESWSPSFGNAQGDTDNGYLGSACSSTFAGCDTWKLAGRVANPDGPDSQLPGQCEAWWFNRRQPGPGHDPGVDHYVFVDGHVKALTWADVSKNDFELFKRYK